MSEVKNTTQSSTQSSTDFVDLNIDAFKLSLHQIDKNTSARSISQFFGRLRFYCIIYNVLTLHYDKVINDVSRLKHLIELKIKHSIIVVSQSDNKLVIDQNTDVNSQKNLSANDDPDLLSRIKMTENVLSIDYDIPRYVIYKDGHYTIHTMITDKDLSNILKENPSFKTTSLLNIQITNTESILHCENNTSITFGPSGINCKCSVRHLSTGGNIWPYRNVGGRPHVDNTILDNEISFGIFRQVFKLKDLPDEQIPDVIKEYYSHGVLAGKYVVRDSAHMRGRLTSVTKCSFMYRVINIYVKE
jgi:hypothetical protein